MRRSARVLSLVVPALTAALASACAGHGITLGPAGHPTDPALLLSCARSVATERGLGDVTQPAGALELQAKSTITAPTPSYDLLTVKIAQEKKGDFRMLVGGASYALRQLRSSGVGTSSSKPEWVGTSPSERVALVRDAVLTQCGTLGN